MYSCKSSNVLLNGFETDRPDSKSVAKVADFGTVRTDDRDRYDPNDGTLLTSVKTHAYTKSIVGTSPYIPPEYLRSGHVSEKTDAFALGE
jgi:serine/threonine protein kinase